MAQIVRTLGAAFAGEIGRAAGDDQAEGLGQPQRHHIGGEELAHPDAGVEALGGEIDQFLAGGDFHLDFGMGFAERGEQRMQQGHHHAARYRKAQQSGWSLPEIPRRIGSGIGGPARFLAATFGCQVEGVDLSEPFVEAARYLTGRTGQSGQVSFQTGSALDLPFGGASFDTAVLQHVAMNIGDRARLYAEIRRVLKAGGRFATFDIVVKEGDLHFPVPWARTPESSFLQDEAATIEAIERAGFRTVARRGDTEAAKEWVNKLRASGPPPSPNLGVVMGADFAQLTSNLGRNLLEGRIGVLSAVFEAAT